MPLADVGSEPTGLRVDRSIARRAAVAAAQAVRPKRVLLALCSPSQVDKSYFESYSSFGIHREMLGDAPRTGAYRAALEGNSSLLRGASVLDVGTGTGILSLFAARAGALRVVGVDGSAAMAALAAQLGVDNGYAPPRLTVLAGRLEELLDAEPLVGDAQRFDVIVSEWCAWMEVWREENVFPLNEIIVRTGWATACCLNPCSTPCCWRGTGC